MSNVLTPFYGEFLLNPVPLELSLVEPCDYACAYCFANLNDRYWANKKGKALHSDGIKAAASFLSNYQNRETLEAKLLQAGYPVTLSNRTDPFSRKNRTASIPLLRIMAELGLQVMIQTKGFIKPNDYADVMECLQPSVWYITISSLDEDFRKRVEVGAPTIRHRLDLIEKVVAAGHRVVIGCNPCVLEWIGDPLKYCQALKDRGAEGAWIAPLDFSKDQLEQLTEREINAMGYDVVDRAKRRGKRIAAQDREFLMEMFDAAIEVGLEPYGGFYQGFTKFWHPVIETYQNTFPTTQDFVNLCYLNAEDGDLISFRQYADVMLPHLPEGDLSCGHYIGATCRAYVNEHRGKWSNYFSYEELLRRCWQDTRLMGNLAKRSEFAFAFAIDGAEQVQLVDDEGLPLIVFHRQGFSQVWVDADNLEPYLA